MLVNTVTVALSGEDRAGRPDGLPRTTIRRFPEEPGQTIARLEDDETVDWDA